MTERLDLEDPHRTRFDAQVVAHRRVGDRPAVVLSRSAFHPEGGGQPADRGWLSAGADRWAVADVQEVEGELVHLLADLAAAPPAGPVEGEVDGLRRRDLTQQHHGQHLLSAAFDRALAARTVSFHLGEEACTIDLEVAIDRLRPLTLAEVEAAANDLVWRDLPVEAREHAPAELATLPLRQEATRGARVVVVRDEAGAVIDASPCGGTHPRRTGEVGCIAVLGAERWGAGARVEFACGGRVLALRRRGDERLAAVAAALRCAPAEAPAAAARVAADLAARRKELELLTAAAAQGEAARLLAAGPGPVVAELAPPAGEPAAWIRAVAQALAAGGRVALLGARGEGRGYLCFARPEGAADAPLMSALLREAVALLGGKGGGAPGLAQGGGPEAARLAEALALARARLG